MTNVIRFPVERRARPTMDLLRDLLPDCREVFSTADAFHLEWPDSQLRHVADANMAEHILNQVPAEPGVHRTRMLDEMLTEVSAKAIAVCRAFHAAAASLEVAQEKVVACLNIGTTPAYLQEVVDRLAITYAHHMLLAHAAAEEAEGAARAIGMARRGEAWMPHSNDEDMHWLCDYQERYRAH